MQSEELSRRHQLPAIGDASIGRRDRPLPFGQPVVEPERTSDAHDSLQEFLGVLSRRKGVWILAIVLTTAGALAYSILQNPLYEGSASVLATSSGGASALSDVPSLAAADDPERAAATNVSLARLPEVASRVISSAPLFEGTDAFLARSRVWAETDADILRFAVSDPKTDEARRLATLYATKFTQYRNELDVRAIRSTRATITRTMAKLAAAGQRDTALFRELQSAVRQLDAAEAVQGSAAILVQPAVSVSQVQPRTARNVLLGLILGAVLGVGIAFLVDRLDTRVRSSEQVESVVGLPVLGELPRPPQLPDRARAVSMVEFPYGPYAEGVRKLRSNVEFANIDAGARTIMVTSALGGEGKTTSASDLAVALARSGKKVAICDLDSRAPSIDRAFGLGGARGIVEVVFGIETLERALYSVDLATPTRSATPIAIYGRNRLSQAGEAYEREDASSTTTGSPRGHLHVLPFGRRKPPNPGDFVGSSAVRQLIADVADTHDIVIIDTPPMVPVSDALAISEYVDAALVVCGLETTRKPLLRSVRKLVAAFPTRVLGLVVAGVPETAGYGPYYVPGPVSDGAPEPEARRPSVRVES